jgi:hypothetical protein
VLVQRSRRLGSFEVDTTSSIRGIRASFVNIPATASPNRFALVSNSSTVVGEALKPTWGIRLYPYQRTRGTFVQLKIGFGIRRAGFGLCTGDRRRELPGGVHQTVDWCTTE